MSVRTLHFIYNGFSEYEVALACSLLTEHGTVTAASYGGEPVKGEGSFLMLPQMNFEDVDPQEFDLLLISGMLNIEPYWEEEPIFEKIMQFDRAGKMLAAICGGPLFLAKAGVLRGKRYTCGIPEADRNQVRVFEGAEYVDLNTVFDQNIITSKGFATVDFALAIGRYFQLFDSDEAYDKFANFWKGNG